MLLEREKKTSFWLLVHIKPERKQSSHFSNPKRFSLLAFLRVIVCTFSIARHFMFASVWFYELKCLVT